MTVFLLIRLHLFSKKYPQSNSNEAIEARLDRFEKYCLPTLKRQQDSRFKALLIMDERVSSPSIWRRLGSYADETNIFIGLAKAAFEHDGDMFEDPALPLICQDLVSGFLSETDDTVITTMLDSDDALHPRFISAIMREVRPDVREYLVFDTFYTNSKYGISKASRNRNNMFHTLVEPKAEFKTCFIEKHGAIANYAPIRYIGNGVPYCMKHYHGENLDSGIKKHQSLPVEKIMKDFYG